VQNGLAERSTFWLLFLKWTCSNKPFCSWEFLSSDTLLWRWRGNGQILQNFMYEVRWRRNFSISGVFETVRQVECSADQQLHCMKLCMQHVSVGSPRGVTGWEPPAEVAWNCAPANGYSPVVKTCSCSKGHYICVWDSGVTLMGPTS
jgi:hypothetical protein